MANIFYDPINGGADLQVYKSPQVISKTDLEAERDALLEVQGLNDSLRTLVAANGLASIGLPSFIGQADALAAFDSYVDGELNRIRDVLDYFDYEAGDARLVVRTEAWQTPIAVQSVSDENVGEEGVLTIDGEFTSWWQSDTPGERKIIWDLRGYPKRQVGLRLRTTAGDSRTWLRGAKFSVATGLAALDDADRIASDDVDLDYDGDAWMELTFDTPLTGRYLQLAVSTSDFGDQIRVREIECRVGIINHDR